MIHAELKLQVPRSHCVVILPNHTAGEGPIDGLDNLLPAAHTFRPVEALRIGDVVEDCELLDNSTGDRFNIPAGVGYRVRTLEVEPLQLDKPMRIFTLVRVK